MHKTTLLKEFKKQLNEAFPLDQDWSHRKYECGVSIIITVKNRKYGLCADIHHVTYLESHFGRKVDIVAMFIKGLQSKQPKGNTVIPNDCFPIYYIEI
jgi:hypothetical protein